MSDSDSNSNRILGRFFELTDCEMKCSEICGSNFDSIQDHSAFIQSGGCIEIIDGFAGI